MTTNIHTRTSQLSMSWQKALPYLIAGLLASPAGLHLLQAGFWVSGDGMHHLHRVAVLTTYLEQGLLYPRWIGEFSFRYGAPVFNFYSPLSYYLAQLIAWFDPLWAMKLTMSGGLLASAILLYHFAHAHVGRWPALAAVVVYALAPYRFVDLYPRAALAEHMAFLWLPFILWAFDGIWEGRRHVWQVIGWAGLLLTHSFSALMFAPFFALYLVWQATRQRSRRVSDVKSEKIATWRQVFLQAAVALGLAVLTTAFFWLPLGLEAKYAGLGAAEVSQGYLNHLIPLRWLPGPFLFDYTTGGGRTDYYFAFGFIPTALLLTALPFLWRDRSSHLAAYGAVTGLLALFMASVASASVWQVFAPILANIQFPWRFLGIATFGAALATTGLVAHIRASRLQMIAVLALATLSYLTSAARLPFESQPLAGRDIIPEHLWRFDRETGQVGSTWGGEFVPVGVTEQRWALGRAAEQGMDGPAMAPVEVNDLVRIGDGYVFTAAAEQSWIFRYHAYHFPGWQVRVDGMALSTAASGDLGLVTAEIPAGTHRIGVRFEQTPLRTTATGMTVVGMMLCGVWCWRERCHGSKKQTSIANWMHRGAPLAMSIVSLILIAAGPLLEQKVDIREADATFGDRAQLLGAEFAPKAKAGGQLVVDLVWLATRQVSTNDKTFVHLVDLRHQIVTQSDSDPGSGFTPTTRWQPGELIPDRHRLTLPSALPSGTYYVMAGMYQSEPFENLLTEPPNVDGRVVVGEVVVP